MHGVSTKGPLTLKEYAIHYIIYWGTKVWNIDIDFAVFKK